MHVLNSLLEMAFTEQQTQKKLLEWLQGNFPRDILIPLVHNSKAPSVKHTSGTWSWFDYQRRMENFPQRDIAILLTDLCALDVDCHSVCEMLEARFPIMQQVPMEITNKGRHYLFARSKYCDDHGFYDGRSQKINRVDFKSRCRTGTSGVLAVAPSSGKTWIRSPWSCYPNGGLPDIPSDLLMAVAVPRHSLSTALLRFPATGEELLVRDNPHLGNMALLSFYFDDEADSRDGSSHKEGVHQQFPTIDLPNCSKRQFEAVLDVCDSNDIKLDVDGSLTTLYLDNVKTLADFLGVPLSKMEYFMRPYGKGHRLTCLFATNAEWGALAVQDRRARRMTSENWNDLLVRVDTDLAARLLFCRVDSENEARLFHKLDGVQLNAEPVLVENPQRKLQQSLPAFVLKVLLMGKGHLALAGGAVVGVVGKYVAPGRDYDLFVYGITSDEACSILEKILRLPGVRLAARTGHAITIIHQEQPCADTITVQIILRLYKSISQIVFSFDLQPCKIAAFLDTDSTLHVLASQSWISTMRSMSFYVDEEAWSTSTAYRLVKYYTRGFDVVLSGLRRQMIRQDIDDNLQSARGVSQLLALEKLLLQKHLNITASWYARRDRRRHKDTFRISSATLQSITPFLHRSSMCDYASMESWMSPLSLLKSVLKMGKKWLGSSSHVAQGPDVKVTSIDVRSNVHWLPNTTAGSLHTCDARLRDAINLQLIEID